MIKARFGMNLTVLISATAAVGLLVKLRQQWERYLLFDLEPSLTTAFLSDELTPPIQSGPSGGSGRATRLETVPPPISDGQVSSRRLITPSELVGEWRAGVAVTLGSHIIGVI